MTTPDPNLLALVERLGARRVRDLADPALLGPLLEALWGGSVAAESVAPVLQALRPFVLATLRADPRSLDDYLPPKARAALLALAQRPLKLPGPLAQALLQNPVLEEVLRDQLYEALREFNERVNPFFAEWGLPTIIRKVMPFGSGAVVRTLEAVRGEFDRRLEPEMRRFLQGFVKRGLQRAAQVLTEGKDGAHGPALRRSLLEALLAQRVELLASALGDEVVALAEEAVTATLTQLLASPRGAELRQGALVALCSAAGDHTLAAALPTEASRAALTALLAHLLGEPTS